MKLINLLIITCIITLLSSNVLSLSESINKQVLDTTPKHNQKEVFSNQYESATMAATLPKANFTAPLLSHSLFEEDPKRKLRKHEFVQVLRSPMYQLTRGETEQIFQFADGNKDDLVDQAEWDNFAGLYIFPYEACDKNGDYLLQEGEFKECLEKDPKSAFITYRRRDQESKHIQIMETVTSRVKPIINFNDYLLIRRGLFAWQNCQSNAKFMAKSQFKCAIKTAILSKMHFKIELDKIYDTGVKVISNDKNIIELDFINYMRTLYAVYVFSVFGEPLNIPYIEKKQFIKAIREDRLPTNFEEKEINYLYDIINTNPLIPVTQMNFNSFAFFLNLHRLFNKYSTEKPLQLKKEELLSLLNDKLCPADVRNAIDLSKSNFTEPQYQESSLILQRLRPNEKAYYFNRFMQQDASENTNSLYNATTVNNTYFTAEKNMENRDIFFTTFAEMNKNYWNKESFYRAFQLGNLFVAFVSDKRYTVSTTSFVDKLITEYTIVDPPISFMQRKNYPVYKNLPRDVYADILLFLTIENYRHKFETHIQSSNQLVYESHAKLILMDFGMRLMPDVVIDLAKKGYDSLRRRTYDPYELIKNCVIVQSVAAEHARAKDFRKDFNIKITNDDSRRFPNWPRRFEATPKV